VVQEAGTRSHPPSADEQPRRPGRPLLLGRGFSRNPSGGRRRPTRTAPDIAGPDPRTLVDLDECWPLIEIPDAAAGQRRCRGRAETALEAAEAGHPGPPRQPGAPSRLALDPGPPPCCGFAGSSALCARGGHLGSRFANAPTVLGRWGPGSGRVWRAGCDVVSGLARGVDAGLPRGAAPGRGGHRVLAAASTSSIRPSTPSLAEEDRRRRRPRQRVRARRARRRMALPAAQPGDQRHLPGVVIVEAANATGRSSPHVAPGVRAGPVSRARAVLSGGTGAPTP